MCVCVCVCVCADKLSENKIPRKLVIELAWSSILRGANDAGVVDALIYSESDVSS